MGTSTETSKIVIDPDGDVMLVLNDGTELLVSFKVLSVASSVFRAMFGPYFREGQNLSGTSPKRISLPENNAAAMATLCNVLHHRHDSVSKTPTETELVNVATACDKYDCSEALSLWSPIWMLHHRQTRSSDLSGVAAKQLYPSFLLDEAESFKRLSKSTVLHTEGFIYKPKETNLMPDNVFEALQRKKQELERRLCHDLEIIFMPILEKRFTSESIWSGHGEKIFCADDGILLYAYLKTLKDLGVWPLSSAFDKRSIASVCTILDTYKCEEKRIKVCKCSVCRIDLAQEVKKAESDAMQSFKGLCLACIKLGDTGTNESRKCQAHEGADDGWSSVEEF